MACPCGKLPKCIPPWEQVARCPRNRYLSWEHLTPCARWKVPTWGQANAECWQNTRRVIANWTVTGDPGDLVVRTKWYEWACATSCLLVYTARPDKPRATVLRWQPFILYPKQRSYLHETPGRRGGADTTITKRISYPEGWPISLTYAATSPGASPYGIRVGPWHAEGPVQARTAVTAVWPGAVMISAVARYTAVRKGEEWQDPASILWHARTIYTVQDDGSLHKSTLDRPVTLESEPGHLAVHIVRLGRRKVSPITEFVSEVVRTA